MRRRTFALLILFAALAVNGTALPTAAQGDVKGAAEKLRAVKSDPAKLHRFLRGMPKGTDLHTHLSGAVYAESMVRWGAEDGKCVDPVSLISSYPPCVDGQVPLSAALTDGRLYDRIISAWSMRGFPANRSGHDHFFATFDLFGAAFGGRQGDGLAEVAQRAANQNVWYIEPLITPQFGATMAVADQVGYDRDFATMRQRMLDAGLRNAIPAAGQTAADAIAGQWARLGCLTDRPRTGCDVIVNFDVQVLRNQRPAVVFAQLLFGFELMAADPRWAGMNMVQPEDGPLSLRDYRLHMRMIKYLRSVYPGGKVTLHAGELVPGMAPPEDLRFHIRTAVEVAGADRIGHGASLRWERSPSRVLRQIKRRGVCLEINLTSNRQILGLRGRAHPIRDYARAGVKVTLSTDDEGVSRTNLTSQYAQAARQHGFGYRALKRFAQNGLRCAFLQPKEKRLALADQAARFRRFEARYPSRRSAPAPNRRNR